MDKANLDLRFGGPRVGRRADLVLLDRLELWIRAAKPAMAIFLIGSALLGITTFLAWDIHTSVARDSTGASRVVDEAGVFGQRGAVVRLDAHQTDAYLAAQVAQHRRDLLLCLFVGLLGLAAGSILIVRQEALDSRWTGSRALRR